MADEAEDLGEVIAPEDVAAPEGQSSEGQEAQQEDSPRTPSGVEDIARKMGWSPLENWRGPKDQWKDAETFLVSTVEINRTLSKDVRGLKDNLDRMSRTTAKIAERAIMDERAKIEARFHDAVAEGDSEGAYRASQELQRAAAPMQEGPDPAIAEFIERNKWFNANEAATAVAMATADNLARVGASAKAQAEAAERAVRRDFPELFEEQEPAPRREVKRPATVNAPDTRAARPTQRAKTAADLPPEARKAGEDFVRRGRIASLDAYAKVYFEENA